MRKHKGKAGDHSGRRIDAFGVAHKSFTAAFSVEAAWVFGITLMIIYAAIALSFTLYKQSMDFVKQTKADDWEAVKAFRLMQMGEDILEGLR